MFNPKEKEMDLRLIKCITIQIMVKTCFIKVPFIHITVDEAEQVFYLLIQGQT